MTLDELKPRGMSNSMWTYYKRLAPAALIDLASKHDAFVDVGKGHSSTFQSSKRLAAVFRKMAALKKRRAWRRR